MAFCGEQGGGKTFGMKTISGHVVAQGGQMFAIDKGTEGEWAYFAEALTEDRAIVDPMTPKWSMDPLRVHDDPEESALIASTFYTTLLGCAPRERDGLTLNQVLRPAYLAAHDLHGSGDLLRHLAKDCELEMAKELAEQMQIYAETIFGSLIFDRTCRRWTRPPRPSCGAPTRWSSPPTKKSPLPTSSTGCRCPRRSGGPTTG